MPLEDVLERQGWSFSGQNLVEKDTKKRVNVGTFFEKEKKD